MVYRRLLAKSTKQVDSPDEADTVPGHLKAVATTMGTVLEARGAATLAALGLDPVHWHEPLATAALRAAWLHDLGKLSSDFQRMLRRRDAPPQGLRHEVVSFWLVAATPELDGWLFAGVTPAVRWAAVRAVVGHHLQFDGPAAFRPRANMATSLLVLTAHPDARAALQAASVALGVGPPPAIPDRRIDFEQRLPEARTLLRGLEGWWQAATDEERRFAAAVAALLIAADACGSAVPRDDLDPARWAAAALVEHCTGDDLRGAALQRLKGEPIRPFQRDVAESRARLTLLVAGCGAGKTAAAYLWAAERCAGGRLFFGYPTTGTASEGFADYALPAFEEHAALVHSRADLDLARLRETAEDEAQGATWPILPGSPTGADRVAIDATRRHAGLRLWTTRMGVGTVDAVLGLVQNNRLGLFAFPALVGGGFVFDEVHLYDDRLFGALLAFLRAFQGAPILLMTATLPPERRREIERVAAELGQPLTVVTGPRELEDLPRYRIDLAETDGVLEAAATTALAGGKVLWVANTVDRAVAAAEAIRERLGAAALLGTTKACPVELYHSRFRYCDRLERHAAVIAGFRQPAGTGGFVAVSTQTCEVSLDISADLLVTEVAPPASLIQRLGRLNRRATPERDDGPKRALVIEPTGERPHLPYEATDLDLGRAWLARVVGRETSQRDLAVAFEGVLAGQPPAPRVEAAWLERGTVMVAEPLREVEYTVTVVRAEDAPRCVDSNGRPVAREVARYAVPMPYRPGLAMHNWRRLGLALVAPAGSIELDPRRGARWRQG